MIEGPLSGTPASSSLRLTTPVTKGRLSRIGNDIDEEEDDGEEEEEEEEEDKYTSYTKALARNTRPMGVAKKAAAKATAAATKKATATKNQSSSNNGASSSSSGPPAKRPKRK